MKQFIVNGVETPFPLNDKNILSEFLSFLQNQLVSATNVITSIRLDGQILSERDERDYADLPLSNFDSLEVVTAHPRKVAENTLHLLIEYTTHLENYSLEAASALAAHPTAHLPEIVTLIDGASTFIDSILTAKETLKIKYTPELASLKTELFELLKETYSYLEIKEFSHAASILKNQLPQHFTEWRNQGIPSIIKAISQERIN